MSYHLKLEVFVPGTPGTVCMKGTDTCMVVSLY